jgi:hypothetical protein
MQLPKDTAEGEVTRGKRSLDTMIEWSLYPFPNKSASGEPTYNGMDIGFKSPSKKHRVAKQLSDADAAFRIPFVKMPSDQVPQWFADLIDAGYHVAARIVDFNNDMSGSAASIAAYLLSLDPSANVVETVSPLQSGFTCGNIAAGALRIMHGAANDDWMGVALEPACSDQSLEEANLLAGEPLGERWKFMEASTLGKVLKEWAPGSEIVSLDQAATDCDVAAVRCQPS